MEFDLASLIIGLVISGIIAWLFSWSEKCSLANRIAYSCCEQARQLIQCKRELVIETKNIDIYNLETSSQIDNNIYPIETEEFKIDLLPSKEVQTDVHISEYIGVYSKLYDLWLLLENIYGLDEGLNNFTMCYFCNPEYLNPEIIKTPHKFNVQKYLTREKKKHNK